MPLGPRARRWLPWLGALVVLLAIGAWWVDRQLEPNRLTALVLDRAGKSLQLDLQFEGQPEYALKPEPRLLIPGFSARGADGKVFLSARRAEISLPWATITGGEPVITRIQLDRPVLDLPGLQRWLAARPEAPFELPTLSKGIELKNGTIVGDGFRVDRLTLMLPHLAEGAEARLTARGRLLRDKTKLDFDTVATLATPGPASDFKLQARLSLAREPTPLKADLRSNGRYEIADAATTIALDSLAVSAVSPLPSFTGKGRVVAGDDLRFSLAAVLSNWPADWPALPEPLPAQASNLPIGLGYTGPTDLSAPLALHVEKGETVVDARIRLPAMLDWLDASPASPLPPLVANMKTPRLVLDGVEMQGVQMEILEDEPVTGRTP